MFSVVPAVCFLLSSTCNSFRIATATSWWCPGTALVQAVDRTRLRRVAQPKDTAVGQQEEGLLWHLYVGERIVIQLTCFYSAENATFPINKVSPTSMLKLGNFIWEMLRFLQNKKWCQEVGLLSDWWLSRREYGLTCLWHQFVLGLQFPRKCDKCFL